MPGLAAGGQGRPHLINSQTGNSLRVLGAGKETFGREKVKMNRIS